MPGLVPTLTSPNEANAVIGRGIVSIQLPGEPSFIDCGECNKFEMTLQPTKANLYSSRVGVQKKIRTDVTRLDALVRFSLLEWTARNVAFALLGLPLESGTVSIDMFANPLYYAAIKVVGTNAGGPQFTWTFPQVLIAPENAIQLIAPGSGDYGTLDLTADVLFDTVSQQFCVTTSNSFAA